MSQSLTPEVTWAQRSSDSEATKNYIWLTIVAADIDPKELKLDIQPSTVTFSGYSSSKKAQYAVTLELYAEVDPKESKTHHSARAVELKLQKKDLKQEFWPRLLKESKKQHFLKTDFDKWVDEDEQDGVADDDYMNQFGGGAPGGMPGGADGGFGGLDFSKLGQGGGGMPDLSSMMSGMGAGGMGGEEGDEEEDEDEDMPDLEEEENAKPVDNGKAKLVEEVE